MWVIFFSVIFSIFVELSNFDQKIWSKITEKAIFTNNTNSKELLVNFKSFNPFLRKLLPILGYSEFTQITAKS